MFTNNNSKYYNLLKYKILIKMSNKHLEAIMGLSI